MMFYPPPPKAIERSAAIRAANALGILDLERLTVDAVRAAFRDRLWETHPDTSQGAPVANVPEAIDALKNARDVLFEWLAAQPVETCPCCRGRGVVPSGNPFQPRVPCPVCQR